METGRDAQSHTSDNVIEPGTGECTNEEAAIIEASIRKGLLEEGEQDEEDVSDTVCISLMKMELFLMLDTET